MWETHDVCQYYQCVVVTAVKGLNRCVSKVVGGWWKHIYASEDGGAVMSCIDTLEAHVMWAKSTRLHMSCEWYVLRGR